jgi:hypothetical protein
VIVDVQDAHTRAVRDRGAIGRKGMEALIRRVAGIGKLAIAHPETLGSLLRGRGLEFCDEAFEGLRLARANAA